MDDLRTRLDTLEQHTALLTQHAHRLTRQLRWWRGLAWGLLVLALLTWALPTSTAQEDARGGGVTQRLAALEHKLRYLTVTSDTEMPPEVRIIGANLRIVNGLGRTDCGTEEEPIPGCPNGVGNLIVGYNEPLDPEFFETIRTGSHNLIVGKEHNFSRFGGLVVGLRNEISGDFAVVSGGFANRANGFWASVSGGGGNTASGQIASISGGQQNTAIGFATVVSEGLNRTAAGDFDWVAGSTHGQDRLCWVCQQRAETRSDRRRVQTREIKDIPSAASVSNRSRIVAS